MLNVLICDDNPSYLDKISACIEKFIAAEDLSVKLAKKASSPVEILEYLQNHKDAGLYFLDIELGTDMNGIELAEAIRKYDPRGFIVFVTVDENSLLLTLRHKVEALDYIVKDTGDLEARIFECIYNAHEKYTTGLTPLHNKFVIKVSTHATTIVDCKDIIYFKNSPILTHNVILVTDSGRYEFRENLSQVERKLDNNFYRCHRSYIVNVAKISSIVKESLELQLENGDRIGISAKRIKKLEEVVRRLWD